VVWSENEEQIVHEMRENGYVIDTSAKGHFVRAELRRGSLTILRDKIGVAPIYYGKTQDGNLCFASEVKGLLPITREVNELSPASYYDGKKIKNYGTVGVKQPIDWGVEEIAMELRDTLVDAVRECIENKRAVGLWLSGNLNSSIISSIAGRHLDDLRTYSIGFRESENLKTAKRVSKHIKSTHEEIVVTRDDLVEIIPEVIYHLESFDTLMVRESLMNFILSREAVKDIDYLLLGDGANELFGGYRHIKSMNHEAMANELVDLTSRLHNTTLQRIDRCTAAHELTPLLAFLKPKVVKLALRIPARYKVYKGKSKWILRETMRDYLPDDILMQTESKFAQDFVGQAIAELAENSISDKTFKNERKLSNGWLIESKEELFYYRIFVEQFGDLEDFSWMGRIRNNSRGERL
jgi:asparagine synthase (glutamine-hydrolysing)